jgi:hypothetical protein
MRETYTAITGRGRALGGQTDARGVIGAMGKEKGRGGDMILLSSHTSCHIPTITKHSPW